MKMFQSRYDRLVGRQKELKRQLSIAEKSKAQLIEDLELTEKARWVITEASKATQTQFKDRVESLVTMAIRSVFEEDITFKLIMETQDSIIQPEKQTK